MKLKAVNNCETNKSFHQKIPRYLENQSQLLKLHKTEQRLFKCSFVVATLKRKPGDNTSFILFRFQKEYGSFLRARERHLDKKNVTTLFADCVLISSPSVQ